MNHEEKILISYDESTYNPVEDTQREISQEHMKKLKTYIELQKTAIRNCIMDRALLKELTQQKNIALLQHLDSNADPRLNQLMKEV